MQTEQPFFLITQLQQFSLILNFSKIILDSLFTLFIMTQSVKNFIDGKRQ